MYFILTLPSGIRIGLIARNRKEIKTWIAHSYAKTKAGWNNGTIKKVTTLPNSILYTFDVSKEMDDIAEFIALHSEMWYNGQRIDL